MKLVIGNKRYSSWSFRPWILMKQAGIPFSEVRVWIGKGDSYEKIRRYSPGGRVPALIDGKNVVWESTAILEYLAEKYPGKKLWPQNAQAKAVARSIAHEMHSGFLDMRRELPCHFLNRYTDFTVPDEAYPDIARIREIWNGCRRQWGKGGPFLFGRFCLADAMYAPVVFRFLAYGVPVDPVSKAYMNAVEALPAAQEWCRGAREEKEIIPAYEK